MKTTRQISTWIIFTGLICALTVGCSKPKKTEIKPRASSPETVKHEARGEPQESGCEDELTDVFFISRATLPHGAIPPSTNTDGRIGFITGKLSSANSHLAA